MYGDIGRYGEEVACRATSIETLPPYISSYLPNLPLQVACRATSIKPHIDALSALVLRWRKMEL